MVFVKVVVNNKELRRLRVSDSRLDNSYRALIEALRPSSVTIPSSLSSSFLTVATSNNNKWGQSNGTAAGASPATVNRRLKEWQLEYQDDEGDRITVTSDVELREAIRVATEAKRTLRLFAWSVNEIGRAAAIAARNQPILDWDDDDYDEIEDEEEPGANREGQPSPHVSLVDSKRPMVLPSEHKSSPISSISSSSSSSSSVPVSSGIGAELKQHQLDHSSINNNNNSESKRTQRSLSMASVGLDDESPFDPLVRSHVRRTLQMFHDYYAGMVNEHRTEQGRMKASLASRIQREAKNGAAPEGELNLVEGHMHAMKELNDRFQDSVTVLLDRYERHMSSLPACPFLLPIVVTLYVCPPPPSTPEVNLEGVTPPPLLVFEQVSLRPTDTIASLRRVFAQKIADSGLPGAKILDTARVLLHRPIRSRHERAPSEPIKKSFTERLFGKKKVSNNEAGRDRSPSIDRKKSPPPVGIPPVISPSHHSPAAGIVPAGGVASSSSNSVERLTYEPIWFDDESVCIGDLPLPWGSHVTLQGVVVETRAPSLSRVVSPLSPAGSSILPSVSLKLSSGILPPISLSVSAPMMIVNAMSPSTPPPSVQGQHAKKSSINIVSAGSPPPLSISSSLSSSLGSSPSSLGPSSILAAVSSSSSSSGVPPFSVTTSSLAASSSILSPPRASTPLEAPHHLLSGAAIAQPIAPSITPIAASLAGSAPAVPYSLMFSPIPLSRDYATHKQVAMERMVAAVNNGDVTSLQHAIDDGADIHSILPGGLGYTILHRAAAMGHLNICNYLLSAACTHLRVAINHQDIQGWTPLMRACKSGHSDIVRLLVEKRANAHMRNQAGQNALGIAALSNNILAIDILTTRARNNAANGAVAGAHPAREQKEGERNLVADDDIEEKAALGNGVVSGGAAASSSISPMAAAVASAAVAARDAPVWQSLLTRELSATHAAGVPLQHGSGSGSTPPSPSLGPALLVPAAPTPAPLKHQSSAGALMPSSPPSQSSSASSSLSSGAGILHNVLHSEHKDDEDFEDVGDDSAWAPQGQPLSRRGSIGGDRALSLSSHHHGHGHHIHDPAGGSSSPIGLVQRLFERTPVYGMPHNLQHGAISSSNNGSMEGMPLTSVKTQRSSSSAIPIGHHNNNHSASHSHDELP